MATALQERDVYQYVAGPEAMSPEQIARITTRRRSESWPVPYLSELGLPFQPGEMITVKGSIIGKSFDISLQSGPDTDISKVNVPLHINILPHDKTITLNSRREGHDWEKAHRIHDALQEGDEFDLRIRALDDRFEIFVNQLIEGQYVYHQPLSSITHIYIDGALELHSVHLGGHYYKLPFRAGIDTFVVGKRLCLSGVPRDDRFAVDLLTNDSAGLESDVPLQLDVRVADKVVVRNSCKNGIWGAEERDGGMPFQKNAAFDLLVLNTPEAFKIYVNGHRFATFAHRFGPNDAVGLRVYGDLELQCVFVN